MCYIGLAPQFVNSNVLTVTQQSSALQKSFGSCVVLYLEKMRLQVGQRNKLNSKFVDALKFNWVSTEVRLPHNLITVRRSVGGRDSRGRVTLRRAKPHLSWCSRISILRASTTSNWVWVVRGYSKALSQARITPRRNTTAVALLESADGSLVLVYARDAGCFPGSFGVKSSCTNTLTITTALVSVGPGSLLSSLAWLSRRVAASYGTRALLLLKWSDTAALFILPSGSLALVPLNACGLCDHKPFRAVSAPVLTRAAALSRRSGHRPRVRGVVKNPNDHPHGGRTRRVMRPQTPWARPVLKSPRIWHERWDYQWLVASDFAKARQHRMSKSSVRQ